MPGVIHLLGPARAYGLIHSKTLAPYNKAVMQK